MMRHGRPVSPLVPLIALILAALIIRPSLESGASFLAIAGSIFLIWQAWVVWRVVRVMRVADFVASKKYEAESRYRLSREYHETEFASARGRRMRRMRR